MTKGYMCSKDSRWFSYRELTTNKYGSEWIRFINHYLKNSNELDNSKAKDYQYCIHNGKIVKVRLALEDMQSNHPIFYKSIKVNNK